MTTNNDQAPDTSIFGEPAGFTDDGVPLFRVCDIAKHIGIDADVLAAGIIAKINGLPIDAFLDLPEEGQPLH